MNIWKDIHWYEWLYQISNYWNIRRIKKKWFKYLKINHKLDWYLYYALSKKGKVKHFRTHRLVASTYLWLDLDNKKQIVCHKNETLDKDWLLNNSVGNIFIGTQKQNIQDMFNKWRGLTEDKHWKSKQVFLYNKDWIFIKQFKTQTACSNELWINQSLISMLLQNKMPKKIKDFYIFDKKQNNIKTLLRDHKLPTNTKKIFCKINWEQKEYIWYKSLCKDLWISIASITKKKRLWNIFTIKWKEIIILKEEPIWQVIYV